MSTFYLHDFHNCPSNCKKIKQVFIILGIMNFIWNIILIWIIQILLPGSVANYQFKMEEQDWYKDVIDTHCRKY